MERGLFHCQGGGERGKDINKERGMGEWGM